MKSFLFLSLALFAMSANAQTKAGGISPEMLQKIEQSQKNCKTQRALRNAIASNNINNLAKNPQKQGPVDNHFSNKPEHPQSEVFWSLLDVYQYECATF